MNISALAERVTEFFERVLRQKCRILTVMPGENDWDVICEVIVDPDYTVKRGMGDIVEIYEVHVSGAMEILGFALKQTKRKAALDIE